MLPHSRGSGLCEAQLGMLEAGAAALATLPIVYHQRLAIH
jgi:hypothetical protein